MVNLVLQLGMLLCLIFLIRQNRIESKCRDAKLEEWIKRSDMLIYDALNEIINRKASDV